MVGEANNTHTIKHFQFELENIASKKNENKQKI